MKHSPSARGILFYTALICAFLVDCSNAYDNEGQPFEANTLGHESIIHSGLRTAPSPGTVPLAPFLKPFLTHSKFVERLLDFIPSTSETSTFPSMTLTSII